MKARNVGYKKVMPGKSFSLGEDVKLNMAKLPKNATNGYKSNTKITKSTMRRNQKRG